MPMRNGVLTDQQAELIEKRVDSARCQHAREVLRVGLRRLRRREFEDAARLGAPGGGLDGTEAAVTAGDLYDCNPTLFDTPDEKRSTSSTQASRT